MFLHSAPRDGGDRLGSSLLRLCPLWLALLAATSGGASASPAEVSGVLHGVSGFSWDTDTSALEYRVYRGDVSDLAQATPAQCHVPGLTHTGFVEPARPEQGVAWYYLVTAVDDIGEGTAGDDSSGANPRSLTACATGDPLGVNVGVVVPAAYESEATPARFEISRSASGTLDEVTVRYTLVGDDDPPRGSADPADYQVEDTGGTPLDYAVVLPQGETAVEVIVDPADDGLLEVPETLQLVLFQDPAYTVGDTHAGLVRIHDAPNDADNERLFVAFLIPEVGVQTTGGGLAVVRVQGDNDRALVNMSFSGLTAPQTAAHVHVSNPVNGPIVRGLPVGQFTGHSWELRASQFLTTDQQMLDALFNGQLYVAVQSQAYAEGEIRGQLIQQEGSTELQVPPDPPPLTTLTGDELDRDIARFLIQSTFGATPALVDEVRQLIQDNGGDRIAGMSAWIDRQMDVQQTPVSSLIEFTRASGQLYTTADERDRRAGWWLLARHGRDQLRQRVAFALSEIFVISDTGTTLGNAQLGTSDYYDNLILAAFGTYRDLLYRVSLHPTMGHFLSHLKNQKEQLDDQGQVLVSPDENYAREIMQLLGFGLIKRHTDGTIVLSGEGLPIPTYDNVVITEMARVFTGLSFSMRDVNGLPAENNNFNRGSGVNEFQYRWLYPMKMFQDFHDEGAKTVFDGHVVPAGQPGLDDVGLVHDLIDAHPTTAPFISRLLIQRFVTSNPSRGYVYRVATRFQQTGGDLGEVVRAILLDYEARSLEVTDGVGFGKLKEPLLRLSALLRMLDGDSEVPLSALSDHGYPASELAKFPSDATIFRMRDLDELGQVALSAPSVFNFFLADYKQAGPAGEAGLVLPEFQITTETQRYAAINYRRKLIFRTTGLPGGGVPPGFVDPADDIRIDFGILQSVYDTELATGTAQSAGEAVVDYIDLYMNGGRLNSEYGTAATPNPRSLMIETVVESPSSTRIKNVIYVMTSSPQLAIQR